MKVDPVILKLEADLAEYKRDLSSAQRITDTKLDAIEKRGASMGASLKSGFNAAKGAALAFAATAGVDMFIGAIKSGLDYASSLGEVAQQLGVTTDALQEYRYAATQVGLSQEEMDQALSQLTRRIGEAASGTKAQAEAFEKLGVSIKDANGNIMATGDAIPEIADALQSIEDPAERAAILMDLFGRAGQKLEPLLSGGAKSVNGLRDAAHELGIVLSSKQIQSADDAADKLSAVKTVLEAKIAGVVADNADAILELVDRLGALASRAIEALNALNRLADSPVGQFLDGLNSKLKYFNPLTAAGAALDFSARATGGAPKSAGGATRPSPRPAGGPINPAFFGKPTTAFGAGIGKLAGFANIPLPEALQRALQTATAMSQELEELSAELAIANAEATGDLRARAAAEKQRIAASLRSDLDRIKQSDATDKDLLSAKQQELAAARERMVDIELQRDLARQSVERASERNRNELDALDAEADNADTLAERRAIERRILALQQEEERARLEAAIAAGDIADAAQARSTMDRKQSAERGSLAQGQEGPGAAYLRSMRKDADALNESYQRVAVDGLQSLNDGLVDAVMGSKSLGDVFKNVANQIIADLLRIAIQKAITEPLANALFGGSGGGGSGGIFGGLLGGLFGRASGGPVAPGQFYRVNEGASPGRVEAFMSRDGGSIIPLGQMNGIAKGGQSSSPSVVQVHVMEGQMFEPRVQAISGDVSVQVVRAAAPQIVNASAQETMARAGRPKL